jgi:hypothetical protein
VTVLPGDEAGDVDLEVADADDGVGRLRRHPPEDGSAASDEHRHVEGLGDVVIRPELEADDHVRGVRPCGEQHDRHAAVPANLAHDLEAVQRGQHHVEDRQVERVATEPLQPLPAVGARRDPEAGVRESERGHLSDRGIVLDQEHPFVHARSVAPS